MNRDVQVGGDGLEILEQIHATMTNAHMQLDRLAYRHPSKRLIDILFLVSMAIDEVLAEIQDYKAGRDRVRALGQEPPRS